MHVKRGSKSCKPTPIFSDMKISSDQHPWISIPLTGCPIGGWGGGASCPLCPSWLCHCSTVALLPGSPGSRMQNTKYGTGPDKASQPRTKIWTSPHHKGQKVAPIRTAKASNLHKICHLKSWSAKLHSHFSVRESLSTKFHPETHIRGTSSENYANFCIYLSP